MVITVGILLERREREREKSKGCNWWFWFWEEEKLLWVGKLMPTLLGFQKAWAYFHLCGQELSKPFTKWNSWRGKWPQTCGELQGEWLGWLDVKRKPGSCFLNSQAAEEDILAINTFPPLHGWVGNTCLLPVIPNNLISKSSHLSYESSWYLFIIVIIIIVWFCLFCILCCCLYRWRVSCTNIYLKFLNE